MASKEGRSASSVRYEPYERPPWPLAAGLALQYGILALGGVVLTVAIVLRSAGSSDAYLAWGAFGALMVSGLTTIVQVKVNVMPFLFDFQDNVPSGASPLAAPVTVLSTLVVTLAVMLRFTGPARLWGPLIGIAAGCVAASYFDLIDTATLA